MATPTQSEYIEVDGVPLATAAWETEDFASLWDTAEVLGDDQPVPYRRGVVPFRRAWGGKRVDIPLTIFGDYDPDGNPASDPRDQLWANRREFIRTIARPLRVGSSDGSRTIRYYAPDGNTYAGPGKVVGGLQPTAFGPSALKVSLALVLTEGGLRSETQVDVTSSSVSAGGSEDKTVPNPGDDYQDALLLDITGTATDVVLTNLTADPGGDVFWEFGGSLSTGVTVDTELFTCVRDAVSVTGLVTFGGFERWLPLVPGDNTIRIEPTGGTAQVRFRHYPFIA